MSRQRQKGTAFETLVLGALRDGLQDNKIHRSPLVGSKDVGDFVNVETKSVDPIAVVVAVPGYARPVAVEAKNHKTPNLTQFVREANLEALNAGHDIGVVVHKRHGSAKPLEQFVTMDLGTFIRLIGGQTVVSALQ